MRSGHLKAIGSRPFLFSLLLIAVLPVMSWAQRATSGINGVVTDTSGAVVPRVKVMLTATSTEYVRTTTTDDAGVYAFVDLPPGVYNISAEAPSFKKAVVNGVRLFVGHDLVQNIVLELGAVTQEVSVTATAPLLRQNTAEVGSVIEGKALTDIPLNGRNYTQLVFLTPGATRSKNGSTSQGDQLNPTNVTANVNGGQGDFNVAYLDGSSFKDYQTGGNTFAPNVDAIQEFIVASSNYSADMGVEAAGQINLVMKSGTNRIHGDAFEFLRNEKLDARNFFATSSNPPFKQNQFGGTVGGPIIVPKYNGRDRTFFFAAYEGLRQVKHIPILENFPTPNQIAGDLSTIVTAGTPLINPYTGLPFTGNKIPQSMMPSTLLPFLQNGIGNGPWIPTPNTSIPGQDYLYVTPGSLTDDQVMVRVDHKVGDHVFLYGHYTYDNTRGKDISSYQGPAQSPSWSIYQARRPQNVAFHYTQSMRTNLLFDFSFGYSKEYQDASLSTAGKNDISNSILKLQSGVTKSPEGWGAPRWSVTGYTNLGEGAFGPRRWKPDVFQFRPAFNLIKGKHTMRFGGEFDRYLETFQQIARPTGVYSFNGRFSGYPLGDFLLGLPSSVNLAPTYVDPQQRYSEIAGYIQDDWKVTPHLTLNLGFRYDWNGIPFSANRSIVGVYIGPNNALPQLVLSDGAKPLTYNGEQQAFMPGVAYTYASKVGLPESLAWSDTGDYGPRFGFAYTVPRFSNTVVRGGYGIFYQRDETNKWVDGALNPPFDFTQIYSLDSTNFRSFNWFNPSSLGSATPLGYYGNDSAYKNGRVQAFNLTLEHTAAKTLFSSAYVGSLTAHLPTLLFPNGAQPPGPGSFDSRRRWPGFGSINWFTYDAPANYNALQLKVQRPFTNGFQILASYTWSKTMDVVNGTYVGEGQCGTFCSQNTFLQRPLDYGPADQDIRHRFVVSYIYELPFGKGKPWANQGGVGTKVAGGWQLNGITTFQAGSPLTIDQGCDRLNSDVFDSHPDIVGNPNNGPKTPTEWFTTSVFHTYCPGAGGPFNYGNSGRNVVVGPGINSWDFAVYRTFPLKSEANRLEFRAEFFNMFNHPVFGQPGTTAGTGGFGEIGNTALDNREIQFGLKLHF